MERLEAGGGGRMNAMRFVDPHDHGGERCILIDCTDSHVESTWIYHICGLFYFYVHTVNRKVCMYVDTAER